MARRLRSKALLRVAAVAGLGCVVYLSGARDTVAQTSLLPSDYVDRMAVPDPAPLRPAPLALRTSIDRLRDAFDGLAGISIRSVDEGWVVDSTDAKRPMPQQSVSKLWVTMSVLDAIDQGRLTLDTPVTIRREDLTLFHQPIAALVTANGYTTTVRDLINRAMMTSDNTANDSLLRTVGGPGVVRAFIARHGLGDIRFGPGERLLQAGTAGLTWRQDMAMGRGFEAARARLSPDVRRAAFQTYVANPIDGAAPSAITAALAKLKRGALLSPASTALLISVMTNAKTGKYRMRGAVPPGWSFGHKTGTGQDLLGRTAGYNDVGLLTAPDGKSYAIAIMIGDTRRPIQDRQMLMQSAVTAVVASHRAGAPMQPMTLNAR